MMRRATTRRECLRAIGLALAALVSPEAASAQAKNRLVVVVNKSNTMDDMSSTELRRILLGEVTRWPRNEKITILLLPAGSEERKALLRILLRMSDDDFTRYWISRVFQGEATAGPKTAASPAMLLRLVSGLSSAIGVLNEAALAEAHPDLKVLRIDGRVPRDEGYPFVW